MSAKLEIELLGGWRIHLGGKRVTGFASTKVQALLCYLALNPRVISRDALLGLLWGEMAEVDARTNLRQALSNLRRLVRDHVITSRESVEFNRQAPYSLDVEEFEKQVNEYTSKRVKGNSPTRLPVHSSTALDLYHGDFLDGFFVRDAPAFEEWMLQQRERLRLLAFDALHTLAAHHARRGEYGESIEYTRRLLALDSWREEAHRQMMLLLARTGQRSAALAQFETCKRVLAEQLGVAPSADTVTLYERIRSADALRVSNLPPQPTTFIGRTTELDEVTRQLSDPACRLLTVIGAGGIGKTRLALQAAQRVADAFLHGVCFVPIGSAMSGDSLAATIAHALKFSLQPRGNAKEQLLDYLRDKEMLFVLDNFEQALDAAPFIGEILSAAPELKLLVTSRVVLHVYGEQEYAVPELAESPATALFVARARAVQPNFALTDENASAVAELCRRLDGLPLAIELAAARIKLYSPQAMLPRLNNRLALLTSEARDRPLRQRSLRGAMDYSYDLLDAAEQSLLARLSVFASGCTADAAAQVCGLARAHHALASLIDQSLLQSRVGADGESRFTMLDTIREYALEKLAARGDPEPMQRQHAEYFLAYAEQAEPHLIGPQHVRWAERLASDIENLRAALEWMIEHHAVNDALHMCNALIEFWETQGYWSEGRRWLARALAIAPEDERTRERDGLRAKALLASGRLALAQGENSNARGYSEQGLGLARTNEDKPTIAALLINLGRAARYHGEFSAAREYLEQALALSRESNDRRGIAEALSNLGALALNQGEYETARERMEECLSLRRELGDARGMAFALNNLGVTFSSLGDWTRARALHEESLALRRQLKNLEGISYSLLNLGVIAFVQNNLKRARALFEESRELARQVGNKPNLLNALIDLGDVNRLEGDFQAARDLYAQGLSLAIEMNHQQGIAGCLAACANLSVSQEQYERAARLAGFVESFLQTLGAALYTSGRTVFDQSVNRLRENLDAATFERLWAEGYAMTLDDAIASVSQK